MHMFVLDSNENVYDTVGYSLKNLKNIGLLSLTFLYKK